VGKIRLAIQKLVAGIRRQQGDLVSLRYVKNKNRLIRSPCCPSIPPISFECLEQFLRTVMTPKPVITADFLNPHQYLTVVARQWLGKKCCRCNEYTRNN
jgi:hypothetical protein